MAFASRLIALVAILLLPFAMTAAPAAPSDQHHSAAMMPMDHCPDQEGGDELGGGFANCAMPCSAALPAYDPSGVQLEPLVRSVEVPALQRPLSGTLLEIATPPPKPA